MAYGIRYDPIVLCFVVRVGDKGFQVMRPSLLSPIVDNPLSWAVSRFLFTNLVGDCNGNNSTVSTSSEVYVRYEANEIYVSITQLF